jgi:hypothetical protein
VNQHALNTEIEAFIHRKDKAKEAYSPRFLHGQQI